MLNKDQHIQAQTVLKEVTQLYKEFEDTFDPDSDKDREWFAKTADFLFGEVTRLATGSAPAQDPDHPVVQNAAAAPATVSNVIDAFPGAEVISQPAAVLPAPQPTTPAVVAGQLLPGATDEEKWGNLTQDLEVNGRATQWWDNRMSKRSPKSADFAHRDLKEQGKDGNFYPMGCWMNSAPAWALQIINRIPAPTAQDR